MRDEADDKTSGGERRRIVSAGLDRGLSMGECGNFVRAHTGRAEIWEPIGVALRRLGLPE